MCRVFLSIALLLAAPIVSAQYSEDLFVSLGRLEPPSSGTAMSVLATLWNRTSAAVDDVDVDIRSSHPRSVLTASHHPGWPANQWSCTTLSPQHVRCRADIAPGPIQFIPLVLTIDPVVEGRFGLTVQGTWLSGGVTAQSRPTSEELVLHRKVTVTNTLDAGPGSLREAIETLNGACARDQVPCLVQFAIPGTLAENEWHPIRLHAPLPPVTAPDFAIRAEPQGGGLPAVAIDGSLLATGHGLDIRGEGPAEVDGLAIGGFPWDGVTISRRNAAPFRTTLTRLRIGVRPDRTPAGNGSRGVTVNAPASRIWIGGNWIAANGRSGVFIAGATGVVVSSNAIGSAVGGESALRNGASAVFAGPGTRDVEIASNYLQGNGHFGVAIARGASGVRLTGVNRIEDNGQLRVDYGLDGYSGTVREGSDPRTSRTPAPRIESAHYDPVANRTTLRGTFDVPDPSTEWTVT
ncbi:MAG TPA: right-handed parallel beta-helix repeat-containing protein, partial [Thermoanaerobaculia bacterium]|nr:right-handed parallel beta-helix repeat-containing protein [Thermoanaerobaculia bacterium]